MCRIWFETVILLNLVLLSKSGSDVTHYIAHIPPLGLDMKGPL